MLPYSLHKKGDQDWGISSVKINNPVHFHLLPYVWKSYLHICKHYLKSLSASQYKCSWKCPCVNLFMIQNTIPRVPTLNSSSCIYPDLFPIFSVRSGKCRNRNQFYVTISIHFVSVNMPDK